MGGCHRSQPFLPEQVARYDAGVVTLPDVQKRISAEASPQRSADPKADEPIEVQRARMARRIVAEQTWLERMTPERLEAEAGLQRQLSALRRSLLLGFLHAEGLGISNLVSEKEARASYAGLKGHLDVPASFTLRHVYVRVEDDSPPETWTAAKKEADEIRSQMLVPGVDLDKLIAAQSDSEDAASGGWIRRLRLGIPNVSRSFEEAVRRMEPGEVSAPVETRRGYQVLLLTNKNPSRTLSFEELRDQIVGKIVDDRREKRVGEILAQAKAEDPLAFDRAAFQKGDPQAVVLQGPKTRLTLAELRTGEPQLAALLAEGAPNGDDAVKPLVEQLVKNQSLVSYALREGLDRRPEFVTMWEARRRDAIVEFVSRGLAREKLAAVTAAELERFYEDHKVRFATARKLHVLGAFLTHSSEDLYATFTRAEALKRQLAAGGHLKALTAKEPGPKAPQDDGDFGWLTHEELATRGRLFHDTVVAAKPGAWIGPVKWERGYAVIRVEGIQESATRPYAEVAAQVRKAYTRRRVGALRETLEAEAFEQRHGELNPALTTPPAATASR